MIYLNYVAGHVHVRNVFTGFYLGYNQERIPVFSSVTSAMTEWTLNQKLEAAVDVRESPCRICPEGAYKPNGASRCLPKTPTCNTGDSLYFGTSTTEDDSLCIKPGHCPPGYYQRNQTCIPCHEGTYMQFQSTAAECVPKAPTSPCDKGYYLSMGTSPFVNDFVCVQCPRGSFTNTTNATKCTVKTEPESCQAGTYSQLGDSVTFDDNACVSCPANTFKADSSASLACNQKINSECDAGFFLVVGSSSTKDDSVCVTCPLGTFSSSKHMIYIYILFLRICLTNPF